MPPKGTGKGKRKAKAAPKGKGTKVSKSKPAASAASSSKGDAAKSTPDRSPGSPAIDAGGIISLIGKFKRDNPNATTQEICMELAKLTNFDEELEPGEEDDGYYLDFDGGQGGDHHAGDFLKEFVDEPEDEAEKLIWHASKKTPVTDVPAAAAAAIAAVKRGKKQSAEDHFFDRQKAAVVAIHAYGPMITRGIPAPEEEDFETSEEYEEASRSKRGALTAEQVAMLRYVLVTPVRAAALKSMEKLVLGEQFGDSFMCFNTSFSWNTYEAFDELADYLKGKTWFQKFDLLLGFTVAINRHSVWMHDHEEPPTTMVSGIAKLWKAVLKKDDKTLMIDTDFTRPGVIALLEEFKKQVEEIQTYDDSGAIKFNYK